MNLANEMKGLKEERAIEVQKLESLSKIISSRAFTPDEQKMYDAHKKCINDFNSRLDVLDEIEKRALAETPLESWGASGQEISQPENDSEERSVQIMKRVPQDRSRPLTDFHLRNFDVDQRMQRANVYKVIRALATGKTNGDMATMHALEETRAVTGSATLNPFLAHQLWDGSLSKSRLFQAGVKVLPLANGEYKFPKINSYPVFEWKAAGASTSDKTTVFENVTFAANTLRGYCKITGELLLDGQNIESHMKHVIDKSIGNSIDSAGLTGAGGDSPTGIRNYSAVNTVSMSSPNGAAIGSYDKIIDVYKAILDDNADRPTAAILSPRDWATIAKLKQATTNQPLGIPGALSDLRMFETGMVTTVGNYGSASGTMSCMYFGGFEQLYLGVRNDVQIQISPVRSDTFEYDFFVAMRSDFQPMREEAFGVLEGIIP